MRGTYARSIYIQVQNKHNLTSIFAFCRHCASEQRIMANNFVQSAARYVGLRSFFIRLGELVENR